MNTKLSTNNSTFRFIMTEYKIGGTDHILLDYHRQRHPHAQGQASSQDLSRQARPEEY